MGEPEDTTWDQPWMVIYPGGNRHRLDIAMVGSWEEHDYALASHEKFLRESEARDYAISLARQHGKECDLLPENGILDGVRP